MAPEEGFEPSANRLTADRSTTELLGNVLCCWLPSQGSNLGKRIQSPSCYHYTTRQNYLVMTGAWCRRSDSNRHRSCPLAVFETAASTIPPLRHGSADYFNVQSWCRGPDLNWGHADFQSAALPTELPRRRYNA